MTALVAVVAAVAPTAATVAAATLDGGGGASKIQIISIVALHVNSNARARCIFHLAPCPERIDDSVCVCFFSPLRSIRKFSFYYFGFGIEVLNLYQNLREMK